MRLYKKNMNDNHRLKRWTISSFASRESKHVNKRIITVNEKESIKFIKIHFNFTHTESFVPYDQQRLCYLRELNWVLKRESKYSNAFHVLHEDNKAKH
ncbi:hypothetical protein Bhyg_11563 [Pseudolycoriella hygida]|uniref:Uncharacterized protein n=1 Tax=Pseudolycoriella hygida TaxID=35572 RepID=A0A9Q0MXE5_9DIPT|nr:hypothetical protein Bhyg_11563 [Pseudolycoriella hygida]